MKKILLVSPHFDDAVLSAGQFMADRPDAEVVTVFGGFPLTASRVKTPYDIKCGFENAEDAVAQRRRENDSALALLEATAINLDFPDGQYGNETDTEQITEKLQEILSSYDYEFIMCPIGLGHPDHIKVTDAVLALNTDLPIYLWEDLPLRVMEPELVWSRLIELKLSSTKLTQHATTNDKMAKKIRSMLCYQSQIHTGILDPYIIYVPERLWQYQ